MEEEKQLVHVYLMPGLAANSSIFEFIKLPEDQFKVHYLEWIIPFKEESLENYAKRMLKYVKQENPVLIGVSFGGVVVQEMARFIDLKRLIIVSSVKCREELPRRMRFAATTGAFKLLPLGLLNYVDYIERIAVSDFLKRRARLYKQYLSVRNRRYLSWAIRNMVLWNCTQADENVIHIHGDQDEVFPVRYISDFINVKGGTHVMIINRYRWFNEHLPGIILNEKELNSEKKK